MKAHRRKKRQSILDTYSYNVWFSVVLGMAVVLLCVCISAVVVSSVDTSIAMVRLLSSISMGVGSYVSGYVCAIQRQKRGIVSGVLCGVLVSVAVGVLGVVFKVECNLLARVCKVAIAVICGGIGGVKSANVHKA